MKKNIYLIAIIGVIFDQIIKKIVTLFLSLYESISVIPGFFNLTYVRNKGAAWGILNGNSILLILITTISLFLIIKFMVGNEELSKIEIISYGLLIGGIVGNLIDRVFYNYVIDFLDFRIFGYNYPVFNFADTFIVLAVILMIGSAIKEYKNGNNSR